MTTSKDTDSAKTNTDKSWQERLWGSSAKKGGKFLHPDDLPGHNDGFENGSSMFTSRRTLAAKAALEPRLRCTEVDEHGKVILVDGEFKKTELIAKVCLRMQDLDWIDSSHHASQVCRNRSRYRTNMAASMACYHEIYEKSTRQTCLISSSDHQLSSSIFSISRC